MAANGLINGGTPQQPSIEEQQMGMAPPMGQGGLNQSVDVGQLYQDWASKNPHADPQAAFAAGVDIGIGQGDGMGLPTGAEEFVPPTQANEFGEDIAPIPGMGTETEWGGMTKTPYDNTATGSGLSSYPQNMPSMGSQGGPQGGPRERGVPVDMSEFGL